MQIKMKCGSCGGATEIRAGQRYHYTESGLDNVYLTNIETRVCESCGEVSARIPRILQLHETIAKALVSQPYPLKGAEVRFLRKQLGLKAKEFALLLRSDVSTYSRWENGEQTIGKHSDLLIRLAYLRLLEEKQQHLVTEPTAAAIAPLDETSAPVNVLVNMDNPAIYTYQMA